jgi:polar amino acid transport system substrate-binding protein
MFAMRKALVALSALVAVVALAVATTATGARRTAATIPGCAPGTLDLLTPGTLTVGADNPAFPPWFGGNPKKPWKVSDPNSGKGYESAVAYAVAKQLGLARSAVKWTYVPFSNSFRPGKKPFDFYLTQVSITPERAKAVTFSKPYYYVNQAIVGRKGKPIASVRSVAGLKKFKLGAQLGTTSYQYIVQHIKPSSQPLVFDTNDLAVQALKNGQIDGLVVDLPTAFYVTAVQVSDGTIVGQFPSGGSREGFGLVLQKGNPLAACVNKAIGRLWTNGTIKNLQRIWLAKATGAPVLK